MRFGRTLRGSIYPPWKDQYMDYTKLKQLLRDDRSDDNDAPWTSEDEQRFADEMVGVQLEKVAKFHEETLGKLRDRANALFEDLKELTPPDEEKQGETAADSTESKDGGKDKGKAKGEITTQRLKDIEAELDQIMNDVRELKKYSSLNYTGFLKIVKKHDRKRGGSYRIRPLMQVNLASRSFNSEKAYSPLLSQLSIMYDAIHQYLHEDDVHHVELESQPETHNGETYTAHKFWIHPDNLLEVKTMILRRLPALIYSNSASKEVDSASADPTLTSLYFDNHQFELYGNKVEKAAAASSLRLRWYGQLTTKPDIFFEQKVIQDNSMSEEQKFVIKEKYVQAFLAGEYKMEKTVQKMERQGQPAAEVERFRDTVDTIQSFVQDKHLEPLLRATYVRTAFQKPADDRIRISIDTDLAFIREDALDKRRPCRDPTDWHRRDIDSRNMTYPFSDITQSDVSKFPFAVLEIKIKEDGSRKRPIWIEDLMSSYLLYPAPRFSKFVHGVATLYDDYVNRLPFWLNDLETDIRRDPQVAFEEEVERKAQRADHELAVGSFLGTVPKGSFKPSKSSPVAKSYLSERAAADASAAKADQRAAEEGENAEESEQPKNYGTLSSVLPSFSLTRYANFKRAQEVELPEGVTEPTEWIKNAGPLRIEPKVWLANERTFLKWQHISVLLGSLSLALYTAAGEHNPVAKYTGTAYLVIAVAAGLWGYYMHQTRRRMIMDRSGHHFDNMIGPMVLSVAMLIAIVLNYVFAYLRALEKWEKHGTVPEANHTTAAFLRDELL